MQKRITKTLDRKSSWSFNIFLLLKSPLTVMIHVPNVHNYVEKFDFTVHAMQLSENT